MKSRNRWEKVEKTRRAPPRPGPARSGLRRVPDRRGASGLRTGAVIMVSYFGAQHWHCRYVMLWCADPTRPCWCGSGSPRSDPCPRARSEPEKGRRGNKKRRGKASATSHAASAEAAVPHMKWQLQRWRRQRLRKYLAHLYMEPDALVGGRHGAATAAPPPSSSPPPQQQRSLCCACLNIFVAASCAA
jgi:hypothetical protein